MTADTMHLDESLCGWGHSPCPVTDPQPFLFTDQEEVTLCSPTRDRQCQCKTGSYYCDSGDCVEMCYRCTRCHLGDGHTRQAWAWVPTPPFAASLLWVIRVAPSPGASVSPFVNGAQGSTCLAEGSRSLNHTNILEVSTWRPAGLRDPWTRGSIHSMTVSPLRPQVGLQASSPRGVGDRQLGHTHSDKSVRDRGRGGGCLDRSLE